MDPMLAVVIPGVAVAFGLICFVINKISIWNFDQKHPELSRNGMRALARRRSERVSPPLPAPFRPWVSAERYRSASAQEEDESFAISLDHFGRGVARDAGRKRGDQDAA